MSAQSDNIFLSTSHSDTISTGATWTSRKISDLPYQPQPMSPTRLGGESAASALYRPAADSASPATLLCMNSRRFIDSSADFPVPVSSLSDFIGRGEGAAAKCRSKVVMSYLGKSRNVLLTGSSLEGGRRTTTDDPSRARPAGGPEKSQEETDYAEAGGRGDRRHGAAGATTPAQAAAERRPGRNPRTAGTSV